MKIVHLSTNDITGGAARAAHRLHTGLHHLGFASSMFVAQRQSDDPTVQVFQSPSPSPTPRDLSSRLRRRLNRTYYRLRCRLSLEPLPPFELKHYQATRQASYGRFSDDRVKHGAALLEQLPPADIINLHWIADFVDYGSCFVPVSQRTPLVWTLHDVNAFTGGCHVNAGCRKFETQCGGCPQLGSTDEHDLSRQIWGRKQNVYGQIQPERLHIVTPSRWLATEAKRSALLGQFSITTIPYGLDVAEFAPRDRTFARELLGIPQHASVILFVTHLVNKRHKGFDLLAQALAALTDQPNLVLMSVGNNKPVLEIPITHLHLGQINNPRLLSLVYSAADIFVIPSRQDNFPNTVLEAMACGIPAVGFAIGGIPDMVRPHVTGLLAPAEDADALGRAIAQLLQNPQKRTEMSDNCRRIALQEYGLEIQARRYVELYETILDQRQPTKQAD